MLRSSKAAQAATLFTSLCFSPRALSEELPPASLSTAFQAVLDNLDDNKFAVREEATDSLIARSALSKQEADAILQKMLTGSEEERWRAFKIINSNKGLFSESVVAVLDDIEKYRDISPNHCRDLASVALPILESRFDRLASSPGAAFFTQCLEASTLNYSPRREAVGILQKCSDIEIIKKAFEIFRNFEACSKEFEAGISRLRPSGVISSSIFVYHPLKQQCKVCTKDFLTEYAVFVFTQDRPQIDEYNQIIEGAANYANHLIATSSNYISVAGVIEEKIQHSRSALMMIRQLESSPDLFEKPFEFLGITNQALRESYSEALNTTDTDLYENFHIRMEILNNIIAYFRLENEFYGKSSEVFAAELKAAYAAADLLGSSRIISYLNINQKYEGTGNLLTSELVAQTALKGMSNIKEVGYATHNNSILLYSLACELESWGIVRGDELFPSEKIDTVLALSPEDFKLYHIPALNDLSFYQRTMEGLRTGGFQANEVSKQVLKRAVNVSWNSPASFSINEFLSSINCLIPEPSRAPISLGEGFF